MVTVSESEKLLNRLSNFCFALVALSIVVPLAFVGLSVYSISNLPPADKSDPQAETTVPQTTEEADSADATTQPAEPESAPEKREPMPNWLFGLLLAPMFLLFAVIIAVVLGVTIVAPAVLGLQLRSRRRYDLSLSAAAVTCGYLPFGTILGGWALLVLSREPVRALFSDRASVPASEDDALYLKLLSRFHYVASVLQGITLAHPLLFMAIPLLLANSPPKEGSPPAAVFWLLGAFGGLFFLWMLAVCICTWRGGRYLRQRPHRVFCLVVAAVNCMAFPQGTILGVCTILVLSRPSVQRLFELADDSLEPPAVSLS